LEAKQERANNMPELGLGTDQGASKKFASIKEGTIRVKTTKDDSSPLLVAREWINPQTKKEGVSYELKYNFLRGVITNIEFREPTFGGNQINVTINGVTLTMDTSSRFATHFMEKLPNIDLKRVVYIRPYDFEAKDGKTLIGLTIKYDNSDGDKIWSAFNVKDPKTDKWSVKKGFPTTDAVKGEKDKWKIHFINVKVFLTEATEKFLEKAVFETVEVKAPVEKESTIDQALSEEDPF